MDWLIIGGIGLIVGGFHGLLLAIGGYFLFWAVVAMLYDMFN